MSKTDNIKRAKLLKQKKRGRETLLHQDDQLEKDQQKLKQAANKEGFKVIDRSVFGIKEKVSTLLLEMVYPLFYEARNEEDIRNMVILGVAAWNSGIIKATKGKKELDKILKSIKGNEDIETRKLIDEYIDIKCTKYSQYNDFITKFRTPDFVPQK
ncbi:MAG: hypothetical protein WCS03_17290 [Bacteroidota bacterium]